MTRLAPTTSVALRALHLVSRIAIRVRSPLGAKALVDRVGRHLPALAGVDGARAAVAELHGHGTCLSRALAVAAMVPGADVVIGIDPWSSARPSAHAWLELDGISVDTNPNGQVETTGELTRLKARQRG